MIRKGTYILIFDMPDARISAGALGITDIRKGTYCYVGSAMNGLDQRVGRHLSEKKKIRWHIDHLTTRCVRIEAYEAVPPGTSECELGMIVLESGGSPAVKGFGCSDCGCPTHLFLLDATAKEKLCSGPCFVPYCGCGVRG
ncbi:MAG: GIY-YIG nuclease family protein [Candidatus Methanoplasma sp.]|jgi:Uri superfamily endonuclease|nr:GIY-YIG nuclease family protein [Candidatus Methanoplasma sp.]